MSTTQPADTIARRPRRRFQFTLGTLMVVVTLVAALCAGPLATERRGGGARWRSVGFRTGGFAGRNRG